MKSNVNFDENLVDRLKNGDNAAFVSIYEKYWHKVFIVVYRRVKEKEIAKELTQNLFLKIWEKREELHINKLENYLVTSIKHAVIDHIEKQLVANRYLSYYKAYVSLQNESTEESVNFNDLSEAIEKGLGKLSEKSQLVFKLTKLDHWPIEKVANHLQLSEKTVGYHLTKSIKFLRVFLKEFTFAAFFCLSSY